MKKTHVGLLVFAAALALASCETLPPWKSMPTGSSAVYGQIQDFRRALSFVAYSDDPGIIAVTVENREGFYSSRYGMIIDQPARNAIRDTLVKYQDWARLAEDNKVEITKEITTVTLPQILMRRNGWEGEGERQVTFVFSARMSGPSDAPRTTLVMRTRSFFYGSDQITLTDQQAGDFYNYLKDEEIDVGYQQAKKKQDALEMFK